MAVAHARRLTAPGNHEKALSGQREISLCVQADRKLEWDWVAVGSPLEAIDDDLLSVHRLLAAYF